MENGKKFYNNFRGNGIGRNSFDANRIRNDFVEEKIDPDYEKFVRIFTKDAKIIPISAFSVNMFYCWFDNLQSPEKSIATKWRGNVYQYEITFTRTQNKTRQLVRVKGVGSNKKDQLYNIVKQLNGITRYQMEEGVDGADTSVKIAASNTAIVVEKDEAVSGSVDMDDILPSLSSTAPNYKLPELTNRWEILKKGTVSTDEDFGLWMTLPKDLFLKEKLTSANLTLFKNFIYSKLELEFKIIVNIPRFAQGKMIASFFVDPHDGIAELYRDYRNMVQRPHVVIDFAANNEATLRMPQNIRRTFIRNIQHESSIPGIAHAAMVEFQLATLSPFRTGANQPTTIPYQIMYRFLKADFYGMSYGVELQMDGMVELLKEIYPPVGVAEKLLKTAGFVGNQDKPYFDKKDVFVPTPRRDFCSGVGLSDSIPLMYDGRATVTTLAEYINPTDPKTTIEIAQIPGIVAKPVWKTSDTNAAVLWEWVVFPCDLKDHMTCKDDGSRPDPKRPIPLNYISSQYAYWRGTLKLRFEFIATAFHTGTVQFEISFNRYGDLQQNASVYTTTFSLGTDREIEIEVPYIYDTPWRRTSQHVQWPTPYMDTVDGGGFGKMKPQDHASNAQPYPLSTEFVSNTRVTMRVLNPLTPLDNVSKSVEVLVFLSAGKDFELMGVVPNFYTAPSYLLPDPSGGDSGLMWTIDQFPIFENVSDNNDVPVQFRVPRMRVKSEVVQAKTTYSMPHKSMHDFWVTKGERFIDQTKKVAYKKVTKEQPVRRGAVYQGKFDHFHSTDNPTIIKNMLRRNTMVGSIKVLKRLADNKMFCSYPYATEGVSVWGTGLENYWIPCYLPAQGIANERFRTSRSAPLSTIPTLFRHWRGSLRYTFVCRTIIKTPIYFAYLPNMGVTYMGSKPRMLVLTAINGMDTAWSDKHYVATDCHSIAGLGIPTEMMIPSVNPTISITVPFDVMFNRCVTNQKVQNGNGANLGRISGREQSTFHCGHIVIESGADVELDVFQSVGDDLELMNFIGTLEYNNVVNYTIPDSFYREKFSERSFGGVNFQSNCVSGDTKRKEPSVVYQMFTVNVGADSELTKQIDRMQHGIAQTIKETRKITDTANEAVGVVRETSTSLNTGVQNLQKTFEDSMAKFDVHLLKMGSNFDRISEVGSSMKSFLDTLTPVIESTRAMFAPDDASQRAWNYSRDFIFDLTILLRNFDYVNFGIMFMKYIAKVLNVGIEKTLEYGVTLGRLVAKKLGLLSKEQFSDKNSGLSSIFGFFVLIITSILKIALKEKPKFYDYGSKFADFIFDPRSINYANGVITFVEKIFKMFGNAVEYVMKYDDTENTVRNSLKKLGPEIEKFIMDVDLLTNPANSRIIHRADVKARIWKTFLFAKHLTRAVATAEGNQAVGVLMKYVNKINAFCEKNWANLACSPVRYEPRVYCFAGGSNIGKSYMSNDLIIDLLSATGYKRIGTNPIFTRAPGRKHWDGFGTHHQCVVFDDWMNFSNQEQVVEQISDLYELKSTCDFIPAMAAVEEKGIRANPKLVVLLTNAPFPDDALNAPCATPEAVYRRRDKLIWSRLKEEYDGVDLHGHSDVLKNFGHIEFCFGDPREIHTIKKCQIWISYEQMKEELRRDFVAYHEAEMANVKRRMNLLCADLPEYLRDLVDPMELFAAREFEMEVNMEGFEERYPSDELEKHIEECLRQVRSERERARVGHQGPKIVGEDDDVIEGLFPEVDRSRIVTGLNYSKRRKVKSFDDFKEIIENRENLSKMLKVVCDGQHYEIPILELTYLMRFELGKLGTRYSDKIISILKVDGATFDFEHYRCPQCILSLGNSIDYTREVPGVALLVNCKKHWGDTPKISDLDKYLAPHDSLDILWLVKKIMAGETNFRVSNRKYDMVETFRFLIDSKNVSEAIYMEVEKHRSVVVNDLADLHSELNGVIGEKFAFRAKLPEPYEEYSDVFFSADRFAILMEFGLVKLGDTIDIYQLNLYLNDDEKFETVLEDWNPEPLNSVVIPTLGREIPLKNPVDIAETNDEQFPGWIYQTFNERPDLTTAMFKHEYDKKIHGGDESWFVDFMRDREIPAKVTRRHTRDLKMQDLEVLMQLLGGNKDFNEDMEIMDTVVEFADGQVKYISQVYKGYTPSNIKLAIKCDHCQKSALFQYGDSKHHVCFGCAKQVSVCDYCLSHPIDLNTIYVAAFLLPVLVYVTDPGRGWLLSLLLLLFGTCYAYATYRFYKTLFYIFGKMWNGMDCIFGIFSFFSKSKAQEQSKFAHLFMDGCFDDLITVQTYKTDVCNHSALLDVAPTGVTYFDEEWTIYEMGLAVENVPVGICKKNCCLLDRGNATKYRDFCKRWFIINCVLMNAVREIPEPEEMTKKTPIFCGLMNAEQYGYYSQIKCYYERPFKTIGKSIGYRTAHACGANPTRSWLHILGTCALSIVSCLITMKGIWALITTGWSYATNGSKETQAGNAGYSRSDATRHFAPRKTTPNVRTKTTFAKSENQDVFFDSLVKKIHRNSVLVQFFDDRGTKLAMSMCIVGLRNRIGILPKHFYREMKKFSQLGEQYEMRLVEPANPAIQTRNYIFSEDDFLVSENSDLCLMKFPKTVREFVNITNYIQSAEDCNGVLPSLGILLRCPTNTQSNLREIETRIYGYEKSLTVEDAQEYNDVIKHGYSENGACGSLLLKKKSTRPIIGLHFAGTTESCWNPRGFCVAISQATFELVDFMTGTIRTEEELEVTYPVEDSKISLDPNMVELQTLFAHEKEVHLPFKTKIIPSMTHYYDGEPKTRQCFLSKLELDYPFDKSPLVAGVEKHGILTKNFSTSVITEVTNALYDAKYATMLPLIADPEKLSPLEAIRGFAIDGYEPMRLNTSAGYPFIFNDKKQKRDYIQVTDEQEIDKRRVFVTQELWNHIVVTGAQRCAGERPMLPFVDENKDERRKFAKVFTLGGTRVFCMSPLSNTIWTRANFLHFAAAYKVNRLHLQHAVGISREGGEWGLLAKQLLNNSENIVTLDYSNFGPGYNAMVNAAGHDIITRWTKQHVRGVNDNEMEVLGEEHYNSIHIAGDLVYKQLSGGPSGDALTVVKNGLVNELYILLAWRGLAIENGYKPENSLYSDFFYNVCLITYGDDAIMSIKDGVIDWFNGVTIMKYFARYNIVATDAEKSGDVIRSRKLTECTFLKSGFARHPLHRGEWLAPLDVVSVTECPRWCYQSDNHEMATTVNCEQGLRLAYGHGEQYFNRLREKINRAMAERGLVPLLLTWKELDRNFFSNYYDITGQMISGYQTTNHYQGNLQCSYCGKLITKCKCLDDNDI